ncbi:phosphoglycerate dehydrogenase [Amnibacterium sp. CER49]|uniref:phosphoglycerate dehydrogenase n=1 Tax=Amnibacterium sp. CER49 TaxID=3039161 RepID=UPI00244CC293|nr:phosphoglycerate dehydrogenase [Amnibacterium sp. CER49]MDH2442891.1 phosphoglycerate dehydrogenase [Amnibacterium sp. CER49]
MTKPIVLLAEQLSPATVDALGPDFDVREVDGTDRPALLAALADADALLVRSATKVDAEAIAAAPRLQVVARAGVGLDNVDLPAATKAGVMVVNAPTSNIVSAAELAIGHLLALARHLPDAHASLKAGEWKRSRFTGVELYDKTVGIVGLGRIGTLVAQRLAAFGVTLVAYDPYVTPARAQQLGVGLLSLDDLMRQADFVTVHIPKTPETTSLIGAEQFAVAKPSLRIVNASRGGIIDEDALARALAEGRIAGAALDVFVQEPPANAALLAQPTLQVTPHLGASTDEAQEKAGVAVARSVRLALGGELVPDAVNVAGGVIDPYVRPGIPLVEKLGQVFAGLADGPVATLDVEVRGELAGYDVSVLKLAALKGFFASGVSDHVSYVNAPLLAEERGLQVRLITDPVSTDYRNVIALRGATTTGSTHSVAGTLTGPKQVERITEVEGYEVDVAVAPHLVVFTYTDRPGIVAQYGALLGEAGINIAAMQIARRAAGGEALSVLTIDSPAAPEVLQEVSRRIEATSLKAIDLVD